MNSNSTYNGWNTSESNKLDNMLLEAVYQSDWKMLENCIKAGANPNKTDDDDLTPLHHAAILGDMEMGRVLFSTSNIKLNIQTRQGYTPLMLGCLYQQEQFIKALLDHGANPNVLNNKQQNALHMACKYCSYRVITFLVAKGTQLNLRDVFDNTPLTYAVINRGSIPITRLLLRKGAKATAEKEFPLFLESILHCYSMDRLKILGVLLTYNVDIYCVNPITKMNCLHYVGMTGYLPAAEFLVPLAEQNLNGKDIAGRLPIDIAIKHENFEVYSYFKNWSEFKKKMLEFEEEILEHVYILFDNE